MSLINPPFLGVGADLPRVILPWLQEVWIVLGPPLLRSLLILLGTYFLQNLISFALERLRRHIHRQDNPTDTQKRVQTLSLILESTSRVVIWGIVAVLVLELFGFDITPILTGAGIVGIAVGFGAQSLIKDILVGFFILLEDQYGIGDVIKLDTLNGTVERMDLRTTHLRDINGNLHIIPNGTISRVTVMTRNWSRALIDLRISYENDPQLAREVILKVGQTIRLEEPWSHLITEEVEVLGVEDLAENGIVLRIIAKTLPGKQWEVMRELRLRLKYAFDQAGIHIPYANIFLPITQT